MRGITITSIVTERGSQVWRQLAKGHARGGGLHRICIRIKIYFYCCWWQFLKLEPLHLLAPVIILSSIFGVSSQILSAQPKNIHGSVALLNFRSQCCIKILYKHVPSIWTTKAFFRRKILEFVCQELVTVPWSMGFQSLLLGKKVAATGR